MSEAILHHYDLSPYAEKIRLIMGLKQLSWRSVQIPIVMPKPDLTALTGGYRLTPVLQIGADIYCDTKVIARRLESEWPEPTLYPAGHEATARGLAFWGETVFLDMVVIGLGMGIFPPEFIEDRNKMVPGGIDTELAKMVMPSKLDQVSAKLDLVERQLADRRFHLLGDALSLADLSVYHPLWALRVLLNEEKLFAPLRHIPAWMERIASIGHGTRTEMDPGEAIEVAAKSTPATEPRRDQGDPNARKPGDRVQVFPEAYGRDPVTGELVFSDAHEIAICRRDQRAGEVVVHFPREGYVTVPA